MIKDTKYTCALCPETDALTIRSSAALPSSLLWVCTDNGDSVILIAMCPEDALALAADIIERVKDAVPAEILESYGKMLAAEHAPKPAASTYVPQGYVNLLPQAQLVVQHMRRAGSISAREAMNDHGITSATLARRIVDIERAGFKISRSRKTHPITGKLYTRYAIDDEPS